MGKGPKSSPKKGGSNKGRRAHPAGRSVLPDPLAELGDLDSLDPERAARAERISGEGQSPEEMQQVLEEMEVEEEDTRTPEEMETQFMAALAPHLKGAEPTNENVAAAIEKMTPEERQSLAQQGRGLRSELMSKPQKYTDETAEYRKVVNAAAEKQGLPVEQDGEHLGKKIAAYMRTSAGPVPHAVVLTALASAPYLVKLALAEAQGDSPRAAPSDLSAIEAELVRLKVAWWTSEEEKAQRPPFVRRNLLLLAYQLYQRKMTGLSLEESTQRALFELLTKVSRLVDMLFQYTLANRWVKPALAITEVQALLANGLWDPADDECREMMRAKMLRQGLKYPKLSVQCRAADAQPGEKVRIKVEAVRCHNYSDEESAELVARIEQEDQAAEAAAPPQPEAGEQPRGGKPPAQEPREGWWVIGEGLRQKGISVGGEKVGADEVMHNTLVGRKPLVCSMSAATMTCEISFDAPEVPGEYKVMVHVRSSGCVGVDARRKCSFQVLRAKRALPSSSSGASTEEAPADETMAEEEPIGAPAIVEDDDEVPMLTEKPNEQEAAADAVPPLEG